MKIIDDKKSIKNKGDCVIRAVSHLTGDSYDDVLKFYIEKSCYDLKKGGTTHAWTYRHILASFLPKKITISKLAQTMKGIPFVGISRTHAMYVNANSELVDAFDSSRLRAGIVIVNRRDFEEMKKRLSVYF